MYLLSSVLLLLLAFLNVVLRPLNLSLNVFLVKLMHVFSLSSVTAGK